MKKILLAFALVFSSTILFAQQNTYPVNGSYDTRPGMFAFTNATIVVNANQTFINKALVKELENGLLQLNPAIEKKMQGLAFLMAITIFHETVHYGRNWNNITPYNNKEYGWKFEDMALGIRIDQDNAQNITNYNFKLN